MQLLRRVVCGPGVVEGPLRADRVAIPEGELHWERNASAVAGEDETAAVTVHWRNSKPAR